MHYTLSPSKIPAALPRRWPPLAAAGKLFRWSFPAKTKCVPRDSIYPIPTTTRRHAPPLRPYPRTTTTTTTTHKGALVCLAQPTPQGCVRFDRKPKKAAGAFGFAPRRVRLVWLFAARVRLVRGSAARLRLAQQPPSRPKEGDNITKGVFVSAATTTHKGAWGVGSNHQQRVVAEIVADSVVIYLDYLIVVFDQGADFECQLQQWCDGGGDPYTLLKTKDAVVAIKRERHEKIPVKLGSFFRSYLMVAAFWHCMNTAEADVEVDDPGAWAGCEQASSTFKSSNIHLPEFIAKVHELSVDPNLHGQ
ncbi:hypothetical protein Tco_0355680 [Tanacetum coccineum]